METKGYTDIHTHILPGIDDGSKDWEMTENMLKAAVIQGVETIIATPHNYPGRTPQDSDKIRRLCEETQKIGQKILPSLRVLTGNEILYRPEVTKELASGHALTLADSSYVLIEFLPHESFRVVLEGMNELLENGYYPVLAHVERVKDVFDSEENISRLLRMGCCLQSNCGSLMGNLFDRRSARLRKMITKRQIHFLGSDCHNTQSRPPVYDDCIRSLKKKISQDILDQLLYTNPKQLQSDDYIL